MINPPRNMCLRRPVLSRAEGAESRWSRDDIRAARRIDLAPLLLKRGITLHDRGEGNIESDQHGGILIKKWYWRWPERDMSGNTIDFYVNVLGLSFNQAMREILK